MAGDGVQVISNVEGVLAVPQPVLVEVLQCGAVHHGAVPGALAVALQPLLYIDTLFQPYAILLLSPLFYHHSCGIPLLYAILTILKC